MSNLKILSSVVPFIDVLALQDETIMLLMCSPGSVPLDQQASVLIQYHIDGTIQSLQEFEGAYHFVLPTLESTQSDFLLVSSMGKFALAKENEFHMLDPIDDGPLGPESLGTLNCKWVSKDGFALGGMSRQLYVYDQAMLKWTHQDDGIIDSKLLSNVAAIYGIAGLSLDEIWVVGGGGEVWRRNNSVWSSVPMPTTHMLNSIALSPSGVVVVGAGGLVAEISENSEVKLIEHSLKKSYLNQIISFHDEFFVVAENGLHVFSYKDSKLSYDRPIPDTQGIKFITKSDENRLWAIGSHKIGTSCDGVSWQWTNTESIQLRLPEQ